MNNRSKIKNKKPKTNNKLKIKDQKPKTKTKDKKTVND